MLVSINGTIKINFTFVINFIIVGEGEEISNDVLLVEEIHHSFNISSEIDVKDVSEYYYYN